MSYASPPPQSSSGGFRLEVTRLGWWMMSTYTLLWLLLFAFTHWVPAADWMPSLEVEQSSADVSFEELEGGKLLVHSKAKELVELRQGDVVVHEILGGERAEIDAPAEGAPPLEAFTVSVYGPKRLWEVLLLMPLGSSAVVPVGFRPWQVITGPLFYPPVGGFPLLMMAFLGFVFFAAPVERMLGRRSFLQLWFVSSLGAVVFGLAIGALIPAPAHFGFAPAVFAVMVVHCMMTPEASAPFHLIFTVLHVKLKWIAAGIAAIVLLRTLGLMGGGPGGGYALAGMVCGYLWWRSGGDLNPRRMMLRRRARANLRVAVDRALGDDDGPIFH